MRIVVVEHAARGGLMHYTWQLCRAMAREGAEVTLVTGRAFELDGVDGGFPVEKLLRLWDPKPTGRPAAGWLAALGRKLRRIWRGWVHHREWARLVVWLLRRRPDVVQFGDLRFPTDLVFLLALRIGGLRLVDVCHNVQPFHRRRAGFRGGSLRSVLFTALYRIFHRVYVHFETNRRLFLGTFPLPPERVVAIRHGNQALVAERADPSRTAEEVRRELSLEEDAAPILFLGSLHPSKGLDVLADAFCELARREESARLVVAGYPVPGFDVDAYARCFEEAGVATRVRIVARYVPTEDLAAWMAMARVCVYPYLAVFQSGAVHLAQTFGRPIVATSTGAFPETVHHECSGLLVAPGDAPALARALERILVDPELAARLGAEAHEDARERFSWRDAARRILATASGRDARPTTARVSTEEAGR